MAAPAVAVSIHLWSCLYNDDSIKWWCGEGRITTNVHGCLCAPLGAVPAEAIQSSITLRGGT